MFPVIELRRYPIKNGEIEAFAHYFESYFLEAFRQLGAMALGQFQERPGDVFTWLRGFADYDARATVNQAFYGGPVWKEHASKLNDRMIDFTNVLLLSPLRPERGVPVLPAVDVVNEIETSRGVVAAQIFPVREPHVVGFAERAEATFASYRAAGAREAGLLCTLDLPNNYPRLPIRSDGPFLVWLGILEDEPMVERFRRLAEPAASSLSASGLLRDAAELLLLDPTPRSRLRWR